MVRLAQQSNSYHFHLILSRNSLNLNRYLSVSHIGSVSIILLSSRKSLNLSSVIEIFTITVRLKLTLAFQYVDYTWNKTVDLEVLNL